MKLEVAPISLRTYISELNYQWDKAVGRTTRLQDLPSIKEWQYWRLIPNKYLGDLAYKQCDMVIPKRGWAELHDMNYDEWLEWVVIHDEFNEAGERSNWGGNFNNKRSVHSLYHFHINTFKDKRKEMTL